MVCTGLKHQQAVGLGTLRVQIGLSVDQTKQERLCSVAQHMAGRSEAQNTIGARALPGSNPGLATIHLRQGFGGKEKAPFERGLSLIRTQN